MDESQIPPEQPFGTPAGAPAPAPAPQDAHPAGARRVKRRIMYTVAGLYALSLAAAALLALQGGGSSSDNKKRSGSDKKGGLLASIGEKDTVGWVPIHGVITNSESGKPWEKGAEQWARKIRALGDTPGVKAIVLDIN